MNNTYTVYCHTLREDGRKYFGATKDSLKHRWANGKGHSYAGRMGKAIAQYGWDAFDHEAIKNNLTEEEAWDLEISLIKEYNTTDEKYGFNSSTGGKAPTKGTKRTPEAIEKMRLKNTGLKRSKEFCELMRQMKTGQKQSEATKQKLREINLGKKHSEETKEKLRQKMLGNSYGKGYKFTEEQRRISSESKIGRIVSEETKRKISDSNSKPVICVETETIYKSAREAERQTGVSYKLISMNCRGKCKSVYGKHWEFYRAE